MHPDWYGTRNGTGAIRGVAPLTAAQVRPPATAAVNYHKRAVARLSAPWA